jgi:hypothetical protein
MVVALGGAEMETKLLDSFSLVMHIRTFFVYVCDIMFVAFFLHFYIMGKMYAAHVNS